MGEGEGSFSILRWIDVGMSLTERTTTEKARRKGGREAKGCFNHLSCVSLYSFLARGLSL